MASLSDYAQLQLRFVDSVQRRYEVIRPIILIGDGSVIKIVNLCFDVVPPRADNPVLCHE
jgi:hypothetical protein